MKVGVFDSGLGGLSILKEILAQLGQYDYVYLGDSARAPYGNHSDEIIYEYAKNAIGMLFREYECQMVIVACNTVSAVALRKLQQDFLPSLGDPSLRILGVLIPLAEEIVESSHFRRVGLIGTRATIRSGAFEKEIEKLSHALHGDQKNSFKVFAKATPLLVPLVEEGWGRHAVTKKVIRIYLADLKRKKVDVLLLGCTHYPILFKEIRAVMGKNVAVPNPGKIVAKKFQEYLARHSDIESKLSRSSRMTFLTTEDTGKFNDIGSKILSMPIHSKKIKI